MILIESIAQMQNWARSQHGAGRRIGFVPTMGCLHEGHLSLVRDARTVNEVVVVSIFVNPTQFGPNEDYDRYPRDFDADWGLCLKEGVDVIFFPRRDEMYAANASTWISENALSQPLCGKSRPDHFRGVVTVVAKLFNAVLPDMAVFGLKDAQQALVVRRMVRDLNFPIDICLHPIVRESDGLAMSSRNRYLTHEQRARALAISHGLSEAREAYEQGERRNDKLVQIVHSFVGPAADMVDYIDLLDCEALTPFGDGIVDAPALLAVAAFFGQTRLIDNVILGDL